MDVYGAREVLISKRITKNRFVDEIKVINWSSLSANVSNLVTSITVLRFATTPTGNFFIAKQTRLLAFTGHWYTVR